MPGSHRDVRLQLRVSQPQATAVEDFRVTEGLVSRAEAVRLLLEIGLDTISKQGRRFWDKKPDEWSPTKRVGANDRAGWHP